MEKQIPSTKQNSPALRKALPDEILFTILARDEAGPETICEWIKQSIHKQDPDKLRAALEIAIGMVEQRDEVVDRKTKAEQEDRVFKTDQIV